MGPLDGIKVIEIPNIGPMQFAGMAARRPRRRGAAPRPRDRSVAAGSGDDASSSPYSVPRPRPAHRSGIDLKHPRARRGRAARCASAPTCSSRASGPAWPSGSASAPTPCRPATRGLVYGRMTGWGQEGPLAARRRPRHQLHRARRRARAHRHRGRSAGPADQPRRRLRRRRAAARVRHPRRAARARRVRAGPGDRRGDGRRRARC